MLGWELEGRSFRVCVKTRVWHWPSWTPASAGVTALDLGAVFRPVIPAKAGIHEFSHRLWSPAVPPELSAELDSFTPSSENVDR
jgi:hypothetical protein